MDIRQVIEATLSAMAGIMAGHRGDTTRPESFLGDLIRDGAWVAQNPGREFYWVLHTGGSYIATSESGLVTLRNHLRQERSAFAAYYWNGAAMMGVL